MNEKPSILVTGCKGQLGSEIRDLSGSYDLGFFFTDIDELDLLNNNDLNNFFLNNKVDHIINCAAYTAVDKAESEEDKARQINRDAVMNLIHCAEKYSAGLIHVSTDYVFDGKGNTPYTEDHPVNPLTIYGKTKLEGEERILNSDARAMIIRTSWLYSSYGNNFVKTIFRLGKERDELGVVNDQTGTPTYARDLGKAILDITDKCVNDPGMFIGGIYHYSNEGACTWYDLAVEIIKLTGIECNIKAIGTVDYPTPAERPGYSVLSKEKIKETFSITVPEWRESLRECLLMLNG